MCGIVGALGWGPEPLDEGITAAMVATLPHRGPDGTGMVTRERCRLGFSRLAIIDVAASPQPFANEDGTIVCVCNGQIYNSQALRQELEGKGHTFRTAVDTEVLVHLWEEHGVDLVPRLDGMFAFALWDSRTQTLLLGRDRAGEKPLYYRETDTGLVFASEIRALTADPGFRAEVDPLGIVRYLAHGFFPAPLSPLRGVRKLPAAHLLVAHLEGAGGAGAAPGRLEIRRYWDLADWFPAPGHRDRRSPDELAEGVDAHLRAAVARRSRSDVPFGVFLSGGIDSSTLLSYVAEAQGPGVPSFSLGHGDPAFDESGYAAETARFFGADHRQVILSEADLESGLRAVGQQMDEPLGDASTIPVYLLSLCAAERVKVVLSGEGADELFGGYPTYLGHKLAGALRRLPASVRRLLLGGAARLAPVSGSNVGFDYLIRRFAAAIDQDLLERHNLWFGAIEPARIRSLLSDGFGETIRSAGIEIGFSRTDRGHEFPDDLARLLYSDFTMYLQDGLLTKVDRAGMLASLETRAPFLDHDLAQYVAGIPSAWKVRRLTTKAVLRRTVQPRLPPAVLKRRKRGFNIPFSRWLLHGFGETLRERFSEDRVAARGLLSFGAVQRLIDEHMARQADHRKPLFALLALDLWCDRTFGDGAAVPWAQSSSLPPLDRRGDL